MVRVFGRNSSRGIFISYSGYTNAAISTCKEALANAVVVLCTLQEFVLLMENENSLKDFLKEKVRGAIIDKTPTMVLEVQLDSPVRLCCRKVFWN